MYPVLVPQVCYAILLPLHWRLENVLCYGIHGCGCGDLLCFDSQLYCVAMLNILQSTFYSSNCALRCYLISDGDGYVYSYNLEIGWVSLSGSTILLGLIVCNI